MDNKTPCIYAYLRVSTKKQDIDNEKSSILLKKDELGLKGDVIWFSEVVTGKKHWRKRILGNLYDQMNTGDTLFFSEISRIERNMLGIMEFLSECVKKQLNIYIVKGNFKIDTSLQSQCLIFAYSLSSQIERELISSRTKNGLDKARENGKIGGRPKGPAKHVKLDNFINDVKKLLDNGSSISFIANKYAVHHTTVKNFMNRNGLIKQNKISKDKDINKDINKEK